MASENVARLRTALLAAGLTAVAFCLGDAVARQYPFGSRTRDVSDLGNQYVPFHAHLWDLLHGAAAGGWLLNWQSGYGSSFLPDYGTYLSSPFAPLVALFPRHDIDLAVYVVTVLKLASAAAAMAVLLPELRPGPRWAAAMLGVSYALCGWTLMLASYNPMWLDGLIAFPLLCLVGEWARKGRRPVAGVLVVAVCWFANFYTAYMATIGAALVLLARLLTEPETEPGPEPGPEPEPGARPGAAAVLALGRAARTTLLGIGLTAPLLLTVVKGTGLAYPGSRAAFEPHAFGDLLTRMLPGTYGFGTPSTYLDTAALLLAFVLPFHPAVPRRTRTVWTVLAVVVALSFRWKPTHLMWHGFATPNGSPYRETFVLSGIMVIGGWLALAHRLPGPRQLGYGAGTMGALIAVGVLSGDPGLTGRGTYPLAVVGLLAVFCALLVLWRQEGPRTAGSRLGVPAVMAVGALLAAQLGQSALSNAWIDRKRPPLLGHSAVWGPRQATERATIAGVDHWPDYRTEPGRAETVANDPLAVGGQGAQYYSSLTADVWSRTLEALGGGWSSHGRSLQSLDNPVTDVIFSVGARLRSQAVPRPQDAAGQPAPQPTVTRRAVPPLVTVRAAAPATGYGPSPYANQELLLGSRVYTAGRIAQVAQDGGKPLRARHGSFYAAPGAPGGQPRVYRAVVSCPAGSRPYFWAPDFDGSARTAGQDPVLYRGRPARGQRAPMAPLGNTAPRGGRFSVLLHPMRGSGRVPADAVGCLDTARLAAAQRRLTATAATRVAVTADGVRAQLPPGSSGFAVIAAPAITGWNCSADGGPSQPASSYLGLVSVPLSGGTGEVSCAFTPPGLRTGEAVGGASLLGVAALAGYGWWQRRRRRSGRGGADVPVGPLGPAVTPARPGP